MAGSVNKVIILGHLGRDPEVRSFQSGDKVCNLSIATSESWKDKSSGERKEKTEWHKVAIYNQALIGVAEKYLAKGSKVYIEGKLETKEYEKDGQKRFSTEIAIRQFGGELTLLDGKSSDAPEEHASAGVNDRASQGPLEPKKTGARQFDDTEIPFAPCWW